MPTIRKRAPVAELGRLQAGLGPRGAQRRLEEVLEQFDLLLDVCEVGRLRERCEPDSRSSFGDDVKGLVGLHPGGDVPGGQFDGFPDGLIRDLHPMVLLVLDSKPLENFDGLFM